MKKSNSIVMIVLFTLLFGATESSFGSKTNASFFPPEQLHLLKQFPTTKAVDQKRSEMILKDILDYFKDAAKLQNAKFNGRILWDNATVNAVAYESGKTWNVDIYGGLVKYPLLTEDAIAVVICHEVGHHLAGYYFKSSFGWASAEGESDYFSTQKCAKAIFEKHQYESKLMESAVEAKITERCNTLATTSAQTCARLHRASLILADILAQLGGRRAMPDMDTPNPKAVRKTNGNHPEAQCRLDTFLAGIYCSNMPYPTSIPGGNAKFGKKNSKESELESAKLSCSQYLNDKTGFRPACWFKAQLKPNKS